MQASTQSAFELSTELGQRLLARDWTITTAESCTGGLIASALTDVAGSSAWFKQGLVTYANESKTSLAGVEPVLLKQHGAVSEPVVCAMAAGARKLANSDVAVAVSGIAGPGGGSADKPVGTVWIAWSIGFAEIAARHYIFEGSRSAIRESALHEALRVTIERMDSVNE